MPIKNLFLLSFFCLATILLTPNIVYAVGEDLNAQALDSNPALYDISPRGTISRATYAIDFVAEIHNDGTTAANPSSARFRLDENNNGSWEISTNVAIPSIPAPGGFELSYQLAQWTSIWTPILGTHKFEVCSDINNDIVETNEGNNCTTRLFDVSDVDLIPTQISIFPNVLNPPVTPGSIFMNLRWKNNSTNSRTHNYFWNRVYIDYNNDGVSDFTSNYWFTGAFINPQFETSGTWNTDANGAYGWTPPSNGTYRAQLCTDTDVAYLGLPGVNQIVESSEGNNCSAWTSFTVGLGVDLKLDNSDGPLNVNDDLSHNLSWTTTNSPTSCTASMTAGGYIGWSGSKATGGGSEPTTPLSDPTYTITLTCSKAGFADAVNSVTVNVGPKAFNLTTPPTGGCTGSSSYLDIFWTTSANATSYDIYRNGSFKTNIPAPFNTYRDNTTTDGGFYSYSITAINSAGTRSSNPASTSTNAPYCPPLSVTCSASPASVTTGQDVTWTAVPAGGSGSGYTYSWSGTDSLTGSSISVAKSYSTTGTKTASVTVDDSAGSGPIGPVACSNSVTVTVASSPDLIVPAAPSINTGTLTNGTPLTFKGDIRNIGTAVAGGVFNNQFTIDLNAAGGVFNPSDGTNVNLTPNPQLTALAINTSSQVVSGSWTAVPGNHVLRLCADQPSPGVAESNETNNCNNNGANVDFPFTIPDTPPPPVVTITPIPTGPGGTCLNGPASGSDITFSWTNGSTPVTWVDISTVSNFASYYHKAVTGSANSAASTTAPSGFNGFVGVSGALPPIQPEVTYYARLNNGSNGPTANIALDICPPGPFNQNPPVAGPCTAGASYVDLSWNASARVTPTGNPLGDRYEVYRHTSPTGTFTYVTTLATGATSYRDTAPACSTTYYYYIAAYNPTNPPAQTPTTTITTPGPPDTTNPTSSISFTGGSCYTSATWPSPIVASAADNIGVTFVDFQLVQNGTPLAIESATFASGTPQAGFWNININPATHVPPFSTTPPNNSYTLSVRSRDGAGNTSGWQPLPAPSFTYAASCANPWIQTTGGDVHSNKEIITPGGP